MDTAKRPKVVDVEFWGGIADGEHIAAPYPPPTHIKRYGVVYRHWTYTPKLGCSKYRPERPT